MICFVEKNEPKRAKTRWCVHCAPQSNGLDAAEEPQHDVDQSAGVVCNIHVIMQNHKKADFALYKTSDTQSGAESVTRAPPMCVCVSPCSR